MAKILIVEDEPTINNLIRMNLSLGGHLCTQRFSGIGVAELVAEENFDLVILDVMLPGEDGFAIAGELKGTPIIFVTAKDGLQDRLKGLRLGADDYISKPFEILELVARVDAVLRRTAKTETVFSFDDITVDFACRKVQKQGADVKLKPKEFLLLEALIRNRNLALSREQLVELVWGFDYEGELRTVDVHIQKLRQKLGLEGRLKTVHKLGYRLEVPS